MIILIKKFFNIISIKDYIAVLEQKVEISKDNAPYVVV